MKITLDHLLAQRLPVADLGCEVRQRLGKPLRRASPLTQLAVSGALACLPDTSPAQPLALLWQSTYGPRAETLALLDEVCCGAGEPLPFDFLASQPSIAAAQLKPWLPALQTAHHLPLDNEAQTQWTLMLALAHAWLSEGRCAQVLCAHLDIADGQASADWLLLRCHSVHPPLAELSLASAAPATPARDDRDFPKHLASLLTQPAGSDRRLRLQSPALPKLAVEFAR